jgi:hypothetical protein
MQHDQPVSRTNGVKLDLEELATRTVQAAESFAADCIRHAAFLKNSRGLVVKHMIDRLNAGRLLDDVDDTLIGRIGDALIEDANALRAGYGDRALGYDTHHDFCETAEMKNLRVRIEVYEVFNRRRRELRHRLKARALIEEAL